MDSGANGYFLDIENMMLQSFCDKISDSSGARKKQPSRAGKLVVPAEDLFLGVLVLQEVQQKTKFISISTPKTPAKQVVPHLGAVI